MKYVLRSIYVYEEPYPYRYVSDAALNLSRYLHRATVYTGMHEIDKDWLVNYILVNVSEKELFKAKLAYT